MRPLKLVSEYTLAEILDEVIDRFGSIYKFNVLTGRQDFDLYYLKKYKYKNTKYAKHTIESIYDDIVEHSSDIIQLDDNHRKLILQMIHSRYRTILIFSEKHPQFSNTYISRVLSGQFCKITTKVKSLLETLDIEL
jgi:hypothetical protein